MNFHHLDNDIKLSDPSIDRLSPSNFDITRANSFTSIEKKNK